MTLYDLRIKLSNDFSVRTECVGIRRKSDFNVLGTHLNNQTLSQLKFDSGEHFEFFEIELPESPEEKLTT